MHDDDRKDQAFSGELPPSLRGEVRLWSSRDAAQAPGCLQGCEEVPSHMQRAVFKSGRRLIWKSELEDTVTASNDPGVD